MFQGADRGGGTLELLGGEQTEGVATEDGGAAALAADPAQGDREGGQEEVRLRLAAAGGEPDQVGGPAVVVAWVGDTVEGEEEEGELEGAPGGVGVGGRVESHGVGAVASQAGLVGGGMPHLQQHDPLGDAEGVEEFGAVGVAQGAHARFDAGDRLANAVQDALGCLPSPGRYLDGALTDVPGMVGGGELGELLPELISVDGRVGQVGDVEHGGVERTMRRARRALRRAAGSRRRGVRPGLPRRVPHVRRSHGRRRG